MSASVDSNSSPSGLKDFLQLRYPDLVIPSEYLAAVQPADADAAANAAAGSDPGRNLVRAEAFAALAPRVLLSRGLDTIADDFTYFSASTGVLNRQEYLGLVSLLERAMPNLSMKASNFALTPHGAVVFESISSGSFTGDLVLGEHTRSGNGNKVGTCYFLLFFSFSPFQARHLIETFLFSYLYLQFKGDRELNIATFTEDGLLQSLSTGLVLASSHDGTTSAEDDADDGGMAAELLELQRRVESQEQKLTTTPAGSAAYNKISADIETTKVKLANFQQQSEAVRSSGGLGGLGGILFALGMETPVPSDIASALAFDGEDSVTLELDLVTMPTEITTLLAEAGLTTTGA